MVQVSVCYACGAEKSGKRKDAIFCSDKCRVGFHQRIKACCRCALHHPSVTKASPVCACCKLHDIIVVEKKALREVLQLCKESRSCFYCGELATEDEHVVPRRCQTETWIVRSCKECNSMAGGEPFASVVDKIVYIRDKRRKKYSRLLSIPEWTLEEIEEMGHNMRVAIKASMIAKEVVTSQLSWAPIPH